jgi:hypothetical protein
MLSMAWLIFIAACRLKAIFSEFTVRDNISNIYEKINETINRVASLFRGKGKLEFNKYCIVIL